MLTLPMKFSIIAVIPMGMNERIVMAIFSGLRAAKRKAHKKLNSTFEGKQDDRA